MLYVWWLRHILKYANYQLNVTTFFIDNQIAMCGASISIDCLDEIDSTTIQHGALLFWAPNVRCDTLWSNSLSISMEIAQNSREKRKYHWIVELSTHWVYRIEESNDSFSSIDILVFVCKYVRFCE